MYSRDTVKLIMLFIEGHYGDSLFPDDDAGGGGGDDDDRVFSGRSVVFMLASENFLTN